MMWEQGRGTDVEMDNSLFLTPGFTSKHFTSLAGPVAAGRWSWWARKGDVGSVVVLGDVVQVC